ncbi:hypothetical protein F5B19DRAFT_110444 [Rostrohypoxylon terebratum]|nr:hypothetical protein F5B19DRAFT_110444 [Rostrohypoxylon terebratum]
MTVVKKSSNHGRHPVAMSPSSSGPGPPPIKDAVEHHLDRNDFVKGTGPISATNITLHKSANSEDHTNVQSVETRSSREAMEGSMNRISAQVAPLKLASSTCSVASSEDTSPQNVISNLPKNLNYAKNTSGDRTSSRYTGSPRDSSGSIMNTVDGGEPANNLDDDQLSIEYLSMKDEMNTDKVVNPSEKEDAESLPDPSLAISNTSADHDEGAPTPRFKSKLPLAIRVNKDPPYPPPSFPLPAPPPGEPRRPRTRERDQSISDKSYPHSSFPQSPQYSRYSKDKNSNQLTEEPTPDSSIAEKQPGVTRAQKAATETSQSSFPTFGGSSLGSSSKYSDSIELPDANKSIHTSEAGPQVPVVVVANTNTTGSQANFVQSPEMPTETGSPIFYGRSTGGGRGRGRNVPPARSTAARGRLDTSQQVETGAPDSNDTPADGQTAPFTLPPIPRLTPFTAPKAPQEVVDATAELRKLALEPTPPDHGRSQVDAKAGQGIPRSHYGMGNLAEANVLSHGDTVIRHPQVPAPSRGTDRIHPSAVVAASTPSRLLTPDFIRSMIHDEVIQFQHDLRTSSITRPGALAMLSRAVEASSVMNQGGIRTFIRHQAALYTPNISSS